MAEPTVWQIDEHDVIESVGGGWDAFAKDNEAAGLAGTGVVGRSLYEFIAGDELRRIHGHLLRSVRTHGTPLSLPFRCDSPDARRFMRLEMRLAGADAVEFRAVLLRAEKRPHLRLLDAGEPRSRSFVVSCSFCHRIRDRESDASWLEIDAAVERMGLLLSSLPPRLVHGVCPACKARILRRLRARGDETLGDT